MTAPTALTLARNGVRRGVRSRSLMLLGVVGPLALGTVLALAFGGSGPTHRRRPGRPGRLGGVRRRSPTASPTPSRAARWTSTARRARRRDLGAVEQQVSDGDVGARAGDPRGVRRLGGRGPANPCACWAAGDNAIATSVVESHRRVHRRGHRPAACRGGGVPGRRGVDPSEALAEGPVEPAIAGTGRLRGDVRRRAVLRAPVGVPVPGPGGDGPLAAARRARRHPRPGPGRPGVHPATWWAAPRSPSWSRARWPRCVVIGVSCRGVRCTWGQPAEVPWWWWRSWSPWRGCSGLVVGHRPHRAAGRVVDQRAGLRLRRDRWLVLRRGAAARACWG